MKNTKKIVAMGIALIMTGVMLAGCGNSTVDHKDYMKDNGSVTASVDKDVEKDSDKKSETADKADKDKKEEAQSEKKADSTENAGKDSKAEDSKKSDTGSSVSNSGNAGNSSNSDSVSKPNTGSGNSNTGNNGNHNSSMNKPSKPSGGNNSNNGNSGNNGNNKPTEPEKPAPHVHNYQVVSSIKGDCSHAGTVTKKCSCGSTITETGSYGDHNMVHHDAQGHEVTDYEYHAICGGCGADFGSGEAGANAALDHTMKDFNDGCVNYSSKRVPVGSHWEETSPAYDECSICGKR